MLACFLCVKIHENLEEEKMSQLNLTDYKWCEKKAKKAIKDQEKMYPSSKEEILEFLKQSISRLNQGLDLAVTENDQKSLIQHIGGIEEVQMLFDKYCQFEWDRNRVIGNTLKFSVWKD